jgi:hypothetical protein
VTICEAAVVVAIPPISFSCPVEKLQDRFTASEQSRVTDSWGTDNRFCNYQYNDPWKWYFLGGGLVLDYYGNGLCAYREPPTLP